MAKVIEVAAAAEVAAALPEDPPIHVRREIEEIARANAIEAAIGD